MSALPFYRNQPGMRKNPLKRVAETAILGLVGNLVYPYLKKQKLFPRRRKSRAGYLKILRKRRYRRYYKKRYYKRYRYKKRRNYSRYR